MIISILTLTYLLGDVIYAIRYTDTIYQRISTATSGIMSKEAELKCARRCKMHNQCVAFELDGDACILQDIDQYPQDMIFSYRKVLSKTGFVCPYNFKDGDSEMCLHYFATPKQWSEAFFSCYDIGGVPLTARTREKLSRIHSIIRSKYTGLTATWLGGLRFTDVEAPYEPPLDTTQAAEELQSTTEGTTMEHTTEGSDIPTEHTTEGSYTPTQHTTEGTNAPTEHNTEGSYTTTEGSYNLTDNTTPSEHTTEHSYIPTEHTTEGSGTTTQYTTEGSNTTSEHTTEGSYNLTENTTKGSYIGTLDPIDLTTDSTQGGAFDEWEFWDDLEYSIDTYYCADSGPNLEATIEDPFDCATASLADDCVRWINCYEELPFLCEYIP